MKGMDRWRKKKPTFPKGASFVDTYYPSSSETIYYQIIAVPIVAGRVPTEGAGSPPTMSWGSSLSTTPEAGR